MSQTLRKKFGLLSVVKPKWKAFLFLSDLVVGVRDEVPPDFGEGVGHPGVRLGGRGEGRHLDVQVLLQVRVLRVGGGAEPLLLYGRGKCLYSIGPTGLFQVARIKLVPSASGRQSCWQFYGTQFKN